MDGERVSVPRFGSTPLHQRRDEEVWRDRLVELHVLSENGDDAAARTAQRWLSRDAEARRVWDEVEENCHQVRDVT